MKRKQWRLLSLLLIFAMILSMMPATAFASTENGIEGQSVTLPILPDGLQAVEYIVSAGSNQYIDLGFTPNQYLNNLKSEIDLQFVLLANITGGTNGTSETSGTTQFYVPYGIDNKKQFVMQSGAGGSEAKFPADLERHTFILDQKNGTANLKTNGQDNIKNITTAPQDYDYNVYLFARNDKNIRLVTPGSVKIYSAKFYDQSSDSDTLIRNMVPCYTTQAMNNAAGVEVSAGTAGMYDLVEGKLYTNANGGSSVDFLIKPDTVDTGNVTNIDANAITTIPYSAYSSIFGSAEADDTNGRIGAVKSGTNESISFKFNVSEEKEYAITVKCSTDKFANGAFNIALDDGSRTFRIAAKETQPTLAGCQNMGVLSEGVHTLTFRSEKNAPGYYFYEIMIIPTNLTTNKVIPVEGNKVTIANYSDFSKTEGSIFCNEVEKCIGLTSTNDRIEFTFDVQEEKVYTCVFTYANQNSSDLTLNYSIDEKSSSFITQGSGGWLKYLNSDVIDFGKLTAGEHKLSFSGAGTAYNLRSVRLSPKYDENNGCQNDALYISLNDDHTLAWLNQSKENESAGTYELVPAGESYDPVSALPLKKIKGRGNSSWTNATKKGYNITLEERKELISGAGAAKKWCLIGCGVPNQDTTFLPSIAAFELFKELGGSYAISWRMVDLYVNDKYVGLYMLTEKVEINKERININSAEFTTEGTTSRTVNKNTGDITPEEQAILDTGIQEFKYSPDAVVVTDGGYVIEAGYYYNDAACGFKTRKGISFELKEPEYVSLEQMARITAYVQDYEDALYSETGYNSKGKHYSDYLDLESAARLFLVDSFIGNKDMYVTSTYLCIDGDADGLKGKLTSGPAWDYNFYELNSNLYGRNSTGMGAFSWVPQLLKKGDFVAKLNEINNANFKNLIQQMNGSEDTEESLKWWEKKYHDAQLQNDFKWNFGYETNRTTYLNAFSTRVNTWDIIWSESTGALRGVTVTNEDGTLTANAPGATTYQWYKVNADNVTTGTAVPGANGDTFTPTTDGIYYVQVNGKALAGTTASTMISAPYSYVMHTHIYDKVDGQAATCTVDGWKDYYKCNGCEKYFTEATGDKEIPDLEAWKLDEGKLGKTGHSYGTPKYTWNADHTSCTAEKTCTASGCGNKVTEDGTVTSTVKTPATCTTKGTTTYTATFGFENGFETQTDDVQDIALAAHSYGTPKYTWNADHTSCTAEKTCRASGCGNKVTEDGTITSTVKTPATCTTKGTTTYTATFGSENGFETQTEDVQDIALAAHSYGTPKYTWNADHTSCTAEKTCTASGCDNKVTEDGTVTSTVKTPATCTTKGTTTYTATFGSENGFETQTDDVQDIALAAHSYGTPKYTWNADHTSCTAEKTCTASGCDNKVTEDGTITSTVKTPATCTTKGTITYTATFGSENGFETQTDDVQDIALAAHSYGTPKYTWNADHTSCTAEKTCTASGCGNKVTEDGTVTSTVKTPATCTTKGTTTYTATFGFENGFETQTEDVQDIALVAHNYSNGVCTVCGAKKTSSGGGIYIPPVQKPVIDNNNNAKTELSGDGTKLTIKAEEGYKVVDVIVNGVSKGAVDTLTGLKTGDKVVVVTEEIETEPTIEEVKEELGTSRLVARSQAVTLKNGKKAIKITWYDQSGNEVKFDGVEIYRSTKRNTGYGKKPIFVSKTGVYYNTSIKPGTKYYYRVRGFRVIDGQKYYTNWSLKAFRAW